MDADHLPVDACKGPSIRALRSVDIGIGRVDPSRYLPSMTIPDLQGPANTALGTTHLRC